MASGIQCGRTDAGTSAIHITFNDSANTVMVVPATPGAFSCVEFKYAASSGREYKPHWDCVGVDHYRLLQRTGVCSQLKHVAYKQVVSHHHSPTAAPEFKGTVKFFDSSKGYGFLIPDGGGQDIYFHECALADRNCVPGKGDAVLFDSGMRGHGRPRPRSARRGEWADGRSEA